MRLARYMRMQGLNVLQPMGWDAFGLPAENAAIANGVPPARWTRENIAYMKKQLQALGFGLDWSRELATCDPDYYRWNQWLFLRMRERGIAYKKTGIVNWDPVDKTVLANEQVIDGHGWRTGALIEKREIPMYYLRITAYAEELLDALAGLTEWPERVRTMQANWIGRSEGCDVTFPYAEDTLAALKGLAPVLHRGLKVFTTRVDTLFGVTFMAISAEHPLADAAAAGNPGLAAFVEQCRRGSTMEADVATAEKRGQNTGLHVLHPLTGEPVQIWVANYVLMSYGEGAVMGVPAHDERDFEFARRHHIPMRLVVQPAGVPPTGLGDEWVPELTAPGVSVNSGEYSGLESSAATAAIAAALEQRGLGESVCNGACGTGAYRASAIGAARYRSFIASGAERCRCPTPICRSGCPKTCFPTARAILWPNARPSCAAFVPPADRARGARPTPWTHSSTRPGISCVSRVPIRRSRRSMSARSTGCRSISTSAASNTPSCTCCIRGSGPARCAIWGSSSSPSPSANC